MACLKTVSVPSHFVTPVGLGVLAATAAAWYVTWANTDQSMSLSAVPFTTLGTAGLTVFFALMTTIMIAMMLPAAFPMIMAYQLMIGRKAGVDGVSVARGTAAFTLPYFLVWGGFGVLSLGGLVSLGLMGIMSGLLSLAPGLVMVGAGMYQFTRAKEACLRHCQSLFSFMLGHWRDGESGAVRMGLSHASYCLGCCWLFMLVLLVTGAMSLVWMGLVSVMTFVEKVGFEKAVLSRVLGVLLVVLRLFFLLPGLLMT